MINISVSVFSEEEVRAPPPRELNELVSILYFFFVLVNDVCRNKLECLSQVIYSVIIFKCKVRSQPLEWGIVRLSAWVLNPSITSKH
jgi:hypothetical protein